MASLPTGTVTFLFTDIEGSTLLLRRLGEDYVDVLALHRRLLRAAFKEGGGQEISNQGDEFFVAFSHARDALAAAVAAQRAIAAQPWPEGTFVRVRMGLHTGEPIVTEAGYVGMDVHRAARICAVGHGGQILLSQTTRDLVAEELPTAMILHDLGEHRLKDLASPEHLFQVTAVGLRADFPPLKSLGLLPNNLPRQLTSFVGREREMVEVKKALASASLVTLTGIGGTGKTRLALQVAADLLNEYPDGVWLVELAALSDPALIPKTAALALGVREEPGRPLMETLLEFARPRKFLLLLDNCEHLLTGCAQLADALLRRCPNLRILATSREPLGILGEAVWPVPPLSLPDRRHPQSVDVLMQCEAVRLFAVRAVLNQPGFAVTPGNAAAVGHICTTLDGIPLAIELAAARVKVLAVEQIEARLSDRFRLLAGGSRTALPRYQTLRATMDWSYELLSEEERTLLRRLSVFAGGWTLEAAEAVCAGQEIQSASILDLLTQLVSKSLVIVETEGGEARYRQLETVRQFGRERMVEPGEAGEVGDRHRNWYVALAERAAPELVGERQAAWLDRLEAEHDNLRAALAWSIEKRDAEAGLRLAGAIWRFWLVRGYLAEGRRWLETLLKRSRDVAPPVRANALMGAGNLAVFGQADYTPGRVFYEESLAIWREVGDKRGIADLLNSLGILAGALGDQVAARGRHEESLSIRRELGDHWGIGVSLHNLGRVAYREGQYESALAMFQESLALWRNLGDKQHIAIALSNLGAAATHLADYASAAASLQEGLEIVRTLGDKRQIAYSLEGFACLAAARGQAPHAVRLFGAAEALREAISVPLPAADRPDYEHWMRVARTALGDEAFETAWAQGRKISPEEAMVEAQSLEAVTRNTAKRPNRGEPSE